MEDHRNECNDVLIEPTGSYEWDEKIYIGTKLIKAVPMDEHGFMEKYKYTDLQTENRPGYKVTYPDGYVSWSPKRAFDDSHRLITKTEKELF